MSRAQSSQIAQTGINNANTASSAALPAEINQLNNPGYTQPQQAAITGATEGGIGAAFGNASEAAANTAARTNNSAGLSASQDALARSRAVTSGQLGAQNQETFANNAQQQKDKAMQGLQGFYGTSLNAANEGSKNNQTFWDQFGGAAAQGLGKGVGDIGSLAMGAAGFLV